MPYAQGVNSSEKQKGEVDSLSLIESNDHVQATAHMNIVMMERGFIATRFIQDYWSKYWTDQ